MNKKQKNIIGILIFVLFLGGAYFAYEYFSDRYEPDNGLGLEDQIREPQPASDFKVFDAKGNEVVLSDFFGKPIFLNFWASWCPPCKAEMPYFEQAYREFGDEITFLMVDLVDGGRETQEKGEEFIKEAGYTFPVYFDNELNATMTYSVYSLPATYLIDAEGYIVYSHLGMMDEEMVADAIKMLQ